MQPTIPKAHDPYRRPSWRWDRIRYVYEAGDNARRCPDDGWVRVGRRFYKLLIEANSDSARYRLSEQFPGIYWAHQIYQKQDNVTHTIEARLLSGENTTSIAQKNGTTHEVVYWYERLFYNVVDRLRERDYIFNGVLGGEAHKNLREDKVHLIWKVMGYLCGPVMLDALLTPAAMISRNYSYAQADVMMRAITKSAMTRKALFAGLSVPVAYNQLEILEAVHRSIEVTAGKGGGTDDALAAILEQLGEALDQVHTSYSVKHPNPKDRPEFAYYDSLPAELRADEMMAVARGEDSPALREAVKMKWPVGERDRAGEHCGESR